VLRNFICLISGRINKVLVPSQIHTPAQGSASSADTSSTRSKDSKGHSGASTSLGDSVMRVAQACINKQPTKAAYKYGERLIRLLPKKSCVRILPQISALNIEVSAA
jgi:hypothetical protein